MRVLVLGGTAFVGRAIVDDLVARGHEPTLFTRGVTGSDLFPDLPRLTGDRDTGTYGELGDWDAVVDVSAYVPRHVAQAGDALGTVGRYLFISTGSVYDREAAGDGITEDSPRLEPVRDTEVIDGETYGRLKVACEDDVWSRYGDRATVVRPGIVAGPHDVTDRFTYWVRRGTRPGPVAVPGRLDQPVQVVDSRDLARLCVLLLEQDRPGVFNAVGPTPPVTLEELVRACGNEDLVELPAQPGFPLVLPDPSWDVMFRRSPARAIEVGMPTTPLAQTAADTRAWDESRGPLSVGFTEEQEAEALRA